MTGNEMVPSLMFMTFGAALLFGVGLLVVFLRKRSNRAAFKRAMDIDETKARR